VPLHRLECGRSVESREGFVPGHLQQRRQRRGGILIVVDDEDAIGLCRLMLEPSRRAPLSPARP
jgi:hypothetical protein